MTARVKCYNARMLPFEIPAGTTPKDLFVRVLPDAHRRLVPQGSRETFTLGVRVTGSTPLAFTYTLQGGEVTVHEEARPAQLLVATEHATLARFLEDWTGPRRFVPSFTPNSAGGAPLTLLTDPRVLKRLVLVSGRIELALPDLDGSRAALVAGAAGGKAIEHRDDDADVVVESEVPVFERLLSGKLGPDEALSGGHVTVRGKKLVAMQFAFALAPFFPVKG